MTYPALFDPHREARVLIPEPVSCLVDVESDYEPWIALKTSAAISKERSRAF